MAANTAPIFTKTPNLNGVSVTAANTRSDGNGTIGTDIFKAWTAGADGGYVEDVMLALTGTTANTTSTATVARIFASSQSSGATTVSNTHLLAEVTLPAVTADSSTGATNTFRIPVNKPMPAGWTILVTNHAAPATNTAWHATVAGGDY